MYDRLALRDNQNGGSGFVCHVDGALERLFARIVQMRVGFVQNQQTRLAEKGARQTNPLALTA